MPTTLKPSHGVLALAIGLGVGYWWGKKKGQSLMTALTILMIGGGFFMMYVSYEAIHNKTAATPLTKLKTTL